MKRTTKTFIGGLVIGSVGTVATYCAIQLVIWLVWANGFINAGLK